jgi:hypothetical protein
MILEKKALAAIERSLNEVCGHEESPARDAGRILLASAIVGGDASKVAEALGWELARVQPIAKRLRKNGIWVGGKVAGEQWFDEEDGDIAFALDVNVALGLIARTG